MTTISLMFARAAFHPVLRAGSSITLVGRAA